MRRGALAGTANRHPPCNRGVRFDALPEDHLRCITEGNHDLSDDVRFPAHYGLTGGAPPEPL
jgi:hypothetical protein